MSPKGIPVTHQLGKMYAVMTGAKFELWLAGPDEHWAAASRLQAPLMPLIEGSGEQTQGETE